MADPPDPVANYLRHAKLSNEQRATLWDAVQAAGSADELATVLQPLQIPNTITAELWDLKATGARHLPSAEDFLPEAPEGSALGRFASSVGAALNPVTMVTGLAGAVAHPLDTLGHIYQAGAAEAGKAAEAAREGRYSEMVGHGAATVLPVIGPAAAAAGEQIGRGDVAGGLGAGVGLVGSVLAPAAITKVAKAVPILPRIGRNVPPAVAEAVQFGLREGVPVDVATATGNRFVRGAQRLTEESLGGSVIAEKARGAQGAALQATGERLAARTSPLPVAAEQAGQAVRDAVTARAAAYDAAADAGYSKLRAIEAQHGIAVDLAPTQAALRPIYDALKREAELVPLMGDKARALTALDRLMRAPDMAPLSIADSALGELKSLARVDQAFRRTAGQGVAAEAVSNLDRAVRAGAQSAGPDAMRALMDGRAATVNKFKTIDVLDKLAAEPVRVFNQATWAKDAGIAQLRNLARIAPNEVRQIGRAWLENAITKATAEGGFGRAQGLLAEWQNLGPQTKQLLFRDAAHVKDLDHFFLLAKKLAENPNPSGTALTLVKGGEVGAWFTAPGLGIPYSLTAPMVAKLLLSPRTTRVLLQGLRLPVSATAARTAWAGQLGRLLQEQAPGLVPAVTDQAPSR
jgi:hypothetical protein